MGEGNGTRRRIKTAWETFRDAVAIISGLALLGGLFAYIGNLVVSYLTYIILAALAVFVVSLIFIIAARIQRRQGEVAAQRAEEKNQLERKALDEAPMSVIREKFTIGERDPVATGLRHLVIPLNKHPDGEWVRCFKNLPIMYLWMQEADVAGASIETMAAEDSIPQTVDAVIHMVGKANEEYQRFLMDKAERERQERTRREAEDRRLRDSEARARGQTHQ